MRSKINLNTILIVLAIVFAGSWSAYSQRQIAAPAPVPTKWEYATRALAGLETIEPEKILNAYGKDGWEVIGVTAHERDLWTYHFKRPVQ